ncbi:hypothetical protein [Acididesulfobacillus acetoxydans]|uniref:hypothetical protein n=1 Tax=Acididesulfobacillus acetoxydans TaxID=1561005 RepID=UPI001F113B2D|nr:hypothetical protein [Acididesulfobacillus acetoxydans]
MEFWKELTKVHGKTFENTFGKKPAPTLRRGFEPKLEQKLEKKHNKKRLGTKPELLFEWKVKEGLRGRTGKKLKDEFKKATRDKLGLKPKKRVQWNVFA